MHYFALVPLHSVHKNIGSEVGLSASTGRMDIKNHSGSKPYKPQIWGRYRVLLKLRNQKLSIINFAETQMLPRNQNRHDCKMTEDMRKNS